MEDTIRWSAYDPINSNYRIDTDDFDELIDQVMLYVHKTKQENKPVSESNKWHVELFSSELGSVDLVSDVIHLYRLENEMEIPYN